MPGGSENKEPPATGKAASHPRIAAIDLGRALALVGMVAFHFSYDLEIFGWLAPGTVVSGFYWWLARIVAGTFIFIAGMGLWLSHQDHIRWNSFWRRLLKILLAAALVSIVTYFALPGLGIFYGILHAIALSSLIGLAFLRLPAGLIATTALVVFLLPYYWSNPFFSGWLVWTGLSGSIPMTADFEPLFPWFAPFLAGIAFAKLLTQLNLWPLLSLPESHLLHRLAWPGRHSLSIYLIHQPVLIALVFAGSWLYWRI